MCVFHQVKAVSASTIYRVKSLESRISRLGSVQQTLAVQHYLNNRWSNLGIYISRAYSSSSYTH